MTKPEQSGPARGRSTPAGSPGLPPESTGLLARLRGVRPDDWIAVGALLAMTLAIFWQGLFDRENLVREDAAYLLQCYYQFAADEVCAGRFPHWNPFAMCGLPFHSTLQGALLYPLRWPLFVLSWPVGYALSLWIHYFLAALFLYILIRTTLKCKPLPSLIGAMSFTFGGFTLGHLSHPNYYLSYPWFVLTVLLISQALIKRRWSYAIGAAIPVGLMGLVGSVHMLLILCFGLGVWSLAEVILGIVRRIRSGEGSAGAILWPGIAVGVALALGAALSMAQMLPAHQQTGLSSRVEVGWEFITEISAHPLRTLIRLTVPFYWGNYRLGYWGENLFHEQTFYMGVIPLIAAVTGAALRWRDPWVRRLLGLIVVAFLVAAGKYLPVYWVLYKLVPWFDRLRDPARLLCWVQFAVACLAAVGLQALLYDLASAKADRPQETRDRRRRPDASQSEPIPVPRGAKVAAVVAGGLILVLIVGCLLRLSALADSPASAVEGLAASGQPESPQQIHQAQLIRHMASKVMRDGDGITWLGILAGVASVLAGIGLVAFRRLPLTIAAVVLPGLLAADMAMFSAGMINYSDMDRPILSTPAHARFLQEHLGIDRYLCLRGRADEVALHRGLLWRIRHAIGGGGGIFHTPQQEILLKVLWGRNRRAMNLAGVRYVVITAPDPKQRLQSAFQDDRVAIIENSQAMPRAFLAREVRVAPDPNAILAEITAGKSDLLDVAWLEQPVEPLPPVTSGPADRGTVEVASADPGRLVMRTQSNAPRQLVLTETYHPEWQCKVDGKPVPIVRTDYNFMSVRLSGKGHQVEWWYEPTQFRRGLAITLTTLALIVGVLSILAFVERRGR